MPTFAVDYTYAETTVPGRDTHRPEHRAWLGELAEAGVLLSSGPYGDGSGALLLFRAESAGALTELLAKDPFARESLIEAVRVLEWSPTIGERFEA
ncbi:YciI family protein [Nocardia sp. NPDC050712]|uniref:YciI family protein n=1 Tax=Nocardia sp. NPDC050712 TaxID=3155518 RepID=UPI0033EF0E07